MSTTKLSKTDREALRRQVGLWTADEAAAVLSCRRIDLLRQFSLGRLSENRDGAGRLLFSANDISRFAQGPHANDLNNTPNVGDAGWFDDGFHLHRSHFERDLAAAPASYRGLQFGGRTKLECFAITEARAEAKNHSKALKSSALSGLSLAERFYGQGPDFFNRICRYAKRRLLNKQLRVGGSERQLRAMVPRLSSVVDGAIKEAF